MPWFSIGCMTAFLIYLFCYIIPYSESSSRKYGKRLNKRVELIASANRSDNKSIAFCSKGKTFTILVENVKVPSGLQYETIPAYTCKNVYIDDELVCKIHRLERLFNKSYLAEFSNKRHDYEVTELIEAAYKEAKKIDKAYWKEWFAKQQTENSFYGRKDD